MKLKLLLPCLLCVFGFPAAAAAHVLDQYLQVTQIALTPGGVRVDLRLIPGVQVADRVVALIDGDGDGQISTAEEQAYAQRVLQDLTLSINDQRAPLALAGLQFPARRELKEGVGAIRLELTATAPLGAEGDHQLFFQNNHLPELGVYLANALVSATNEIRINGQQRDALQRGLRLDYRVMAAATTATHPLHARWRVLLVFCLCFAALCLGWRAKRLLPHQESF